MYDYRTEIYEDINYWMSDNADIIPWGDICDDGDLQEWMQNSLWSADSVTGNASGSYTFNTYEAEENICHNIDLLQEALTAFGDTEALVMDFDAEKADVTIRCYLLGEVIAKWIDDHSEWLTEHIEEETAS